MVFDMSTEAALLILTVVLSIAWAVVVGGRLPKGYGDRACQGRRWRKAFPGASKREIRAFLTLFVGAFGFKDCEKLKLTPADKISVVYRALYPYSWQADALEVETLELDLGRHYGLKLALVWHDQLTLGELFSQALAAPHQSTHAVVPSICRNIKYHDK
jgi:propanediol dehydratase small subunit